MESSVLSQRLLNSLNQSQDLDMMKNIDIAQKTLGVFCDLIFGFVVPGSWHFVDIELIDQQKLIFHWTSNTEEAECLECNMLSQHKAKIYETRLIQDLPIAGYTTYHSIRENRFYCDNPECDVKTFFEQFTEFADKDARLSHRLKDLLVRTAIESSCIGASRILKKTGVVVSDDTIGRETKKKGVSVVEQNLKCDDVKVLSIDDINLRKGNSSTSCTVFIDAETHRVLVIVQGSTGEVTEKVMKKFPSVEMASRDRGTAYASAATKLGIPQVADGFHLVQNIHQTVKDALSLEVAQDLFVREGDGWISMVDSPHEKPEPDTSEPENGDGLVVIRPATLAAEDIERRIHLAGLTTTQANKYRKTLEIIDLTEQGLYTKKIAKKLSMKTSDVRNYRKNAPETIENVEQKVDEYYKMHSQEQWEYHQRTISKNARSSSESIVEPYKETVLRMFNEGSNHRKIHPVIVQEGFRGSANAVYQFLIKYCYENNIPYGRNSRVISPEDRNDQGLAPRPPRISIERTSRDTIYQCLLHTAASIKEKLKQALSGLEATPNDRQNNSDQSTPEEWINKTGYTDDIAEIIFDTKPKGKTSKKN